GENDFPARRPFAYRVLHRLAAPGRCDGDEQLIIRGHFIPGGKENHAAVTPAGKLDSRPATRSRDVDAGVADRLTVAALEEDGEPVADHFASQIAKPGELAELPGEAAEELRFEVVIEAACGEQAGLRVLDGRFRRTRCGACHRF